ncbi:hypothetical protein [Acinetobacter sp.]|uniref:hypothetical protein n=1 Tax=Acinetobacter sp. TaxID=472 RepID=UPI00388FAAD2
MIFHASNAEFAVFEDRPAWFSLTKHAAEGWHTACGRKNSISYMCIYLGGHIANENETVGIAKLVWPDDDLIYSMYDESVGEFEVEDIRKFYRLLQANGFDAAYLTDYDPRDSDKDSRTLVVFHPNKHVNILGKLKL